MDLARAVGKFAQSPVYGWDYAALDWVDTGVRGRLQAYVRSTSGRNFGQKKRILTVARDSAIPSTYDLVRIGEVGIPHMVESSNYDVEGDDPYATTLALFPAPFPIDVCVKATTNLASGVKLLAGETIVKSVWGDLERFGDANSTEFDNTGYTGFTFVLPKLVSLNTDMYLKRRDTSELFDVNETFNLLDLPAARCQRRGN